MAKKKVEEVIVEELPEAEVFWVCGDCDKKFLVACKKCTRCGYDIF